MLAIYHEKQQQLSRQLLQKNLAHAIIIQGIKGAGKDMLAQWLIELLICQQPLTSESSLESDIINHPCGQCKACLLRKSNNFPDHLVLDSDNKTLGVDDIRRGNTFLEKTAHLGKIKTILIPQAQRMTVAAANALLKTLEEPSPNSYIVLTTDDLDSLLPTMISRCAVYTIRPKVGEALLAQLSSTATSIYAIDNGARSSHNALLTEAQSNQAFVNLSHLPELTDQAVFEQCKVFTQYVINYLDNGQHESELLSQLVDNQHSLRWLEKIVANLMRQHYLVKQGEQAQQQVFNTNSKLSPAVLNQLYQAIISSHKLIKSHSQTNKQFAVEQLLMTINDIVRS